MQGSESARNAGAAGDDRLRPEPGSTWTESYPPAPAPHGEGPRLAFVLVILAVVAAIVWALS